MTFCNGFKNPTSSNGEKYDEVLGAKTLNSIFFKGTTAPLTLSSAT